MTEETKCTGEGFSYNTYTAEYYYKVEGEIHWFHELIYAGHYKCCAIKKARKFLKNPNNRQEEREFHLNTWQGGKIIETEVVT